MEDFESTQEQNHPLYRTDRDHLDRMLAKESPSDSDIVDLARLFIRYSGFPGAVDLQEDMKKILNLWNMNLENLNLKAKDLWTSGFRPGNSSSADVGSGFDTSDKSET